MIENIQFEYTAGIDVSDIEPVQFEITGEGKLKIVNTGGSDAAEGGMGSGSGTKQEKGDLSKVRGSNTLSNPNRSSEKEDTSHDPVGKEIKKAEREAEEE